MGVVIVGEPRVAPLAEPLMDDNSFKDTNKKKKRRSRRSKPDYLLSACGSLSEICMDEQKIMGGNLSSGGRTHRHEQLNKEDIVGSAIRTLHTSEGSTYLNLRNQHSIPLDLCKLIVPKSGPQESENEESDRLVLIPRRVKSHARQKYFPPHFSTEAINNFLEKGELLSALFCVNAHNRLEAYCKIEGLQTDVLISGLVAQNRAVEGDTVVISIDPLPLWPKMKGLIETVNDSTSHANCSVQNENLLHLGKNKLEEECTYVRSSSSVVFSEDVRLFETGSSSGTKPACIYVNGMPDNHCQPVPYSRPCNGENDEFVNSFEKLCKLVSLFPTKRPTGKVVAVMKNSPRRDRIVGFFSVKQWLHSRESRKDLKNNHQSKLNHMFIILAPIDPRFSRMAIPVITLPGRIKEYLEVNDETVENLLVGAKMVGWAEDGNIPEARVIQIFGRGHDVEAQIASILFANAVNVSDFPSEALSCVSYLPWEVPHTELLSRRDMRNLCVFTIDPPTASDLDDALSVEQLSNGDFMVGVHVTDVSYFVLPDSPLDMEAKIRSTSVYLLQRKISMLPPVLSDDFASLNPGKDRLAFSMFWRINSRGEIIHRSIERTLIRSCCKLSYENAQDIIEGSFDILDSCQSGNNFPKLFGHFEWIDVIKSIKILNDLSKVLKEIRFKGGALSLESSEVSFLFSEEGIPYDIVLLGSKDANFLVEEFMLLANRTAAEVITRAYPDCALLRRHPEPNARKLREFEAFCNRLGFSLDASSSTHLHNSLERLRLELKNDPVLFDILKSYAARSMQLASYFCTGGLKDSDSDWGHYVLAVPLYTHFTSPLRRYPDILVHRALAATLDAENNYLGGSRLQSLTGDGLSSGCFTGLCLNKDDIEKAQEALSISATKFGVPSTETLSIVAEHCNEKNMAARYVKDAINKLYMWVLIKRKKILHLHARVLGLGPRFMSIFVSKLSIERRIYYDEIEGLTAEWLGATSTLVLSHSMQKWSERKIYPGNHKLEEVALITNPTDLDLPDNNAGDNNLEVCDEISLNPAIFPLTLNILSTIPIVLNAVGGDDGPIEIVARLYMSSYFQ